jgi:hypothetical protein
MAKLTIPPPSVDYAPLYLQKDLIEMQQMSNEELLTIANSKITENQEKLHLQLLENNQNNKLNESDKFLLENLRVNVDKLMLKKTYAYAVLQWRGYPIPNLNELIKEE